MSGKADDRARKVAELKSRFPEADTDVIRDALTHAHNDVHTAANILIGFGCKQSPPVVLPQQPRFPQPSQAAPVRAVQPPPRASVFDDFNSTHVERALEQARGNQAAALEVPVWLYLLTLDLLSREFFSLRSSDSSISRRRCACCCSPCCGSCASVRPSASL